MSDEQQLLARARELADLGELADQITTMLGAARRAGLDPDALGGLVGAAAALDADGLEVYRAGRGAGARYADDRAFASDLADIEDELADRQHAAEDLAARVAAALAAAELALGTARAMPVREPCNGCHAAKAAAIAAAEARIALCEDADEILAELTARLHHALARLRAVPGDLGEVYESVCTLIRRGGRMPYEGRWIEGTPA